MINTNADNRPSSDDLLEDEWFKIDSNKYLAANNIKDDSSS